MQPVKIKECELSFFFILFLILFSFQFIFHFSIFRTLGLGLEVTSHNIDHGTWEKEVEGSKRSDVILYGHHMLILYFTHGYLGQNAQ